MAMRRGENPPVSALSRAFKATSADLLLCGYWIGTSKLGRFDPINSTVLGD
jgi:hypothetical protein